ncbi:MAG: serine/threonine protein kinase [Deltaproteobacteria bacterium]|nr:serine/threonine protein kinase [Deltaproteobacteria bacterium]
MTQPQSLAEGRYLLVKPLGEGGMATVYRAYDQRLQVWRAVKILAPEYSTKPKLCQRFEGEAQTMALLEHSHIVRVYDVGHEGNTAYIVMELVEAGCLVDWLDEFGPMPPRMAVRVTQQICDGLTAAHAKGVIHRDIKPHNVLVTRDGTCRVTDFGIARVMDGDAGMTKTGAVMGTWGYMAPEQRTDAKHVDARADLYATAASLYSLLTNRLPMDLFLAERDDSMMEGIPAALVPVLIRATEYRKEDRYDSMVAFKIALEDALALLPEDPPETPPLARDPGDPLPPPDPALFAGLGAGVTGADFLEEGGGAGRTILPLGSDAGQTLSPEQGGLSPNPTIAPDQRHLTLPPEYVSGAQMSGQVGATWQPGQSFPPAGEVRGTNRAVLVGWVLAGAMGLGGLGLGGLALALVLNTGRELPPADPVPVVEAPTDPPPQVEAPPVVEVPEEPPVVQEPPPDPAPRPDRPPVSKPPVSKPPVEAGPVRVVVVPDPDPVEPPVPEEPPAVKQCVTGVAAPGQLDLAAGARFSAKLCVEDGTAMELWFRPRGGAAWSSVRMPFALGTHRTKLDLDDRFSAGLEYYITAGDHGYGSPSAPIFVPR